MKDSDIAIRLQRGIAAIAILFAGPAFASEGGQVVVTPDALLAHITSQAPETPVHPRLLWMDKGRRVLINVATDQKQAGAGGGQFADYVPFSYIQRVVELSTGRAIDIGKGYDPAVAAHGDVVAFFPEGSRQRRVIVTDIAQTGSCEIVDTTLMPEATGIEAVALTGNGAQIAVAIGYGASRFAPTEKAKAGGAAVRVMDGSAPSAWGHSVALWVVDRHCGGARRIADLPETRIGRLTWVQQDQNIVAVTARPVPESFYPQSDLQYFDVAARSARRLVENIGGQGAAFLQPSPDGALLAFTYDQEGFGYQLRKQLAVASVADGRIRMVSKDPRERPAWLDNQTLLTNISGAHPLTQRSISINLKGREQLLPGIAGNAVLSDDGAMLGWMDIDLYGAATLSVAEVGQGKAGWTAHNKRAIWRAQSPLASYIRAERRFVSCKSSDGVRPEAILVLPLNYERQRRYPLLVDIHGGPRGGLDGGSHAAYTAGNVLNSTSLEHDMWAAKGYAVLVPDFRASGLYGFDAVSRTGEGYADDFKDIMCNVDAVIGDGIVDTDRMAVIGHSYGGYEVNWIVTHSHRFKAAISKEGGFVDQMIAWGALGKTNQLATKLYGTPIENPGAYRRMSPINFTRGVSTPTMFVTHRGGTMSGDLYGWMYSSWREQGIDVQYRIYDDPNHVLTSAADQRDQLDAAIMWVDHYVNPVD